MRDIMVKIYGTESATPSVKPMTQPSVITSGEIYDFDGKNGSKKVDKKDKKSIKKSVE
jgi:hypothetical protein